METLTPATDQIKWTRDLAASPLAPLGRRWAHTLAVVERAQALETVLPASKFDDVGYALAIARAGFHCLDGA